MTKKQPKPSKGKTPRRREPLCNPEFVNGITNNDCTPRRTGINSRCRGEFHSFRYPGSSWTAARVDAEVQRAIDYFARYCIRLTRKTMTVGSTDAATLRNWYRDWYQRMTQAIGGVSHIGTTTVPTGLVDEFRNAMIDLQRLAGTKGANLLVVFMDEYITDHRPSLISGVCRNQHQIGINWLDRGSPYILAHELVHALGKSAPDQPGAVTWSHNSPCQKALTTIQRTDQRTTIDLSGRFLEVAEFQEIGTNRGGNILTCAAP